MAEATRKLEVPTEMQWSFEPRLNGLRSAPYSATNLLRQTPFQLCSIWQQFQFQYADQPDKRYC
jgi:hypothetical protein